MKSSNLEFGELIDFGSVIVFCGNRNSNPSRLQNEFPALHFQALKQTHGDLVFASTLKTQELRPEADAHWTKELDFALCISTADCIPVFIFDPTGGMIAAIHAGWRGVQNTIIKKTIETLLREGQPNPADLFAYIGPHLQMSSFEIENSIRDQILDTVSPQQGLYRETEMGKSLVDLHEVARQQILSMGLLVKNIYGKKIDTRTDSLYHSFRRDRELSGRQVSFVAARKI